MYIYTYINIIYIYIYICIYCINKYIPIFTYVYLCILYIYIYNNLVIELYIYERNYTYIKELCEQVLVYNEETQCTSHISCVLELPQIHFGNIQESTLFS